MASNAKPKPRSTVLRTLDDVQQRAVDMVVRGDKSVFISGEAGTGKSEIINHITGGLAARKVNFRVTSTTGASAVLIGGCTVHNFAKFGIVEDLSASGIEAKVAKAAASRACALNLGKKFIDVVIVDEVSMWDLGHFHVLDKVCRLVRGKMDVPFGGIQMVFFGDFLQLAPVRKQRYGDAKTDIFSKYDYIFQTPLWRDTIGSNVVLLKRSYRQEDPVFLSLLRHVRNGTMEEADKQILEKYVRTPLQRTIRVKLRTRVDRFEERRRKGKSAAAKVTPVGDSLSSGDDEMASSDYGDDDGGDDDDDDEGGDDDEKQDSQDERAPYVEIDVSPVALFPMRNDAEALNSASLNALPGRAHAYQAIIASSNARYDPFKLTSQAAYTAGTATGDDRTFMSMYEKNPPAASRLVLKKHAQVMLLVNMDVGLGLCNGSRGVVVDFEQAAIYSDATGRATSTWYPVVQFDNGLRVTIQPHRWANDYTSIYFEQIPLSLAWGITIHKAQGMTLSEVSISMQRIFADGQAYVALSRVKTLDGLYLQNLDTSRITANTVVRKFYDNGCIYVPTSDDTTADFGRHGGDYKVTRRTLTDVNDGDGDDADIATELVSYASKRARH